MQLPELNEPTPAAESPEARSYRTLKRRVLQVWGLVGCILVLSAVVYLLGVLSVPVSILAWTLIFVFCLRGIVNGLEKRGVNRTIGTVVAYVVFALVVGVVVAIMCSPAFGIGEQFNSLVTSAPDYIRQISAWVGDIYGRYSYLLQNDTVHQWLEGALAALSDGASDIARMSATSVVAFGSGVANVFVAIGFALVIAFWILMELPDLGRECRRLAGPKHEETLDFLHITFTRVMGGYIKGTVVQCAVIGVGCGVCFFALGIPNSVALGVIAGVLNVIPIIGPWFGGALAAVVGMFEGPVVALVAIVGTVLIQQFVYTFVSPRIMADSVDVHPALTILALMVGSALGGAMSGLAGSLIGMLASIPAAAVLKSVFVYYFEKRTGRRLVSEDGVFFQGTTSESINPMHDATSPHPDASTVGSVLNDLSGRLAKIGKEPPGAGKHGKH